MGNGLSSAAHAGHPQAWPPPSVIHTDQVNKPSHGPGSVDKLDNNDVDKLSDNEESKESVESEDSALKSEEHHTDDTFHFQESLQRSSFLA